ncbi:NifQ family protein [Methylocella silvestris BL2]|uniref:NifQ family protein n=1 Tax=Methylocella silvestris (strain DSM 15510 / CIP 108128 / LMG 27833 / NCIMB 13906 / BL2) TaxID=395965 RepID=B8EJ16_METSB|nr:nitrogen fixation protein NifQ [Methylocella silvestris]ACK52508.1 NifQ family protein [Methylocella silvestris BL2]
MIIAAAHGSTPAPSLNAVGRGERAPDPAAFYDALRAAPAPAAAADPFTAHVLACILAVGLHEAALDGSSLGRAVGLDRDQLAQLLRDWLPAGLAQIDLAAEPSTAAFDDEEEQLLQLLQSHQADQSAPARWLTAMVVRRSMSDNHLWQDLGLIERAELTRLMDERFPHLAGRNVSNMKWKKFFYRSLCEMEGFTLCTAPSCRECADFDNCFGEETGESALARIRRDAPRAG